MVDKKVVYEKWPRVILLLTIVWTFVIASALIGNIWGLLFFGLCAITITYPFIDPKKTVIFIGSDQHMAYINEELNKRVGEIEIFRYSDEGFIVRLDKTNYEIKWDEIQTVFGYSVDLMATDVVELEVFSVKKNSVRITGSTPGGFAFFARTKQQLFEIDASWNLVTQSPSLPTYPVLIYEKKQNA
jgi:hypothetical protein